MKDFFKKIVSKINLGSKRTGFIVLAAVVLIGLFFVGRHFYDKYHISDYSDITLLVNNREYAKAEEKLQNILKEDASDPYFLILVARTYIGRSGEVTDPASKNDYLTKAIQALNSAEAINPNISQIYSTKGLAYLYLGEYNFASIYYKKALALEPNSQNILIDMGNLYLATRNITDGFDVFTKVLKVDPHNESARIGLLKLYMLQNKYDRVIPDAVDIFATTASDITKLQVAEIMGSAYLKLNKYPEAEQSFGYILKQNPNSAFATYGTAEVSFDSTFDLKNIASSTEESKRLALRSVSLDPSYPYNYVLLARIALVNKNKADYDTYVALAGKSLSGYTFLSESQKTDLLNTIPKYNGASNNVKIKQTSIISTTTMQKPGIFLKK